MRLVDTERFAIISSHIIPEIIEDTWEEGYCECLRVLDMTPTVEAIPIEWLEKWWREHFTIDTGYDYFLHYLGDMLEDWEKENGKEKTIIEKSI